MDFVHPQYVSFGEFPCFSLARKEELGSVGVPSFPSSLAREQDIFGKLAVCVPLACKVPTMCC